MSKIQDSLNIIKHVSVFRLWNLVLLKGSYVFSKWTKKTRLKGLPFALSIEPTTACNLSCPECPSGLKQFTRATGKLNLDFHKKILDSVGKQVFYINYYFQGEPFLNPQFLELIREAKKRNIYTATSTNAHFIDSEKAIEIVNSGLDRLIISIDGLTQETYANYRVNGELSKVIEGTKNILRAKNELKSHTPHLIFQFLVVQQNEHEIAALHQMAQDLNIKDVRLKTAQFYEYKHGNILMPKDENYSRYKKLKDGTFALKYKVGNHCWRMWSSSVITWDGSIVPCCFDKDAKHILGTIQNQEFQQIWTAKKYKLFRTSVLLHRNQIDICQNCSEGAKVWI
ncbi:MAG: SPASM domain-containing protein [Flavobacteriia bacterium]|nr:SPASM domain-containing protein [Flavobacteriia bacterium]